MRLSPTSLRGRLALLFAVGAGAALAVGLTLLYSTLVVTLDEAVNDGLSARMRDLRAAVHTGDLSVLQHDRFAQLIGPDGDVVVASGTLTEPSGSSSGQEPPREPVLRPDELRLARQGVFSVTRAETGLAEQARLAAEPVPGGSVLVVGSSLSDVDRAKERLALLLVVAGPLMLAALALAGWLLAGAALRPVAALTDEAAVISAADASNRLPVPPGEDELARLARTLNAMLARLAVSFERERTFVDDASHELRTPIAVLSAELELGLLAQDDPAEMARSLQGARREAERLGRLAEDLLVLARERSGALTLDRRRVDLHDLVLGLLDRLASVHHVHTEASGGGVVVFVDHHQLERLVDNVVANAAHAGAGRVRLETSAADGDAVLEVADDGPGFAAEVLPIAVERFARGSAARTRGAGGAGLGLSIVAAIARAHGGNIALRNGPPLGGAVVRVRLPAKESAGALDRRRLD